MTSSLGDLQRAALRSITAEDGEGVYRSLVRCGLGDMMRFQLPRTAAHLGPRWERDVERFFNHGLSRSRYVRDIAFELFAHASPSWRTDPDVPPFICDLARWELLGFEITSAPDDPEIAAPSPLELERKVALSASLRIFRAEHAVHALPDDDLAAVPAREAVVLAVYRDAELEQRTLSLTPSAAALLERLLAGATLGEAVTGVAAERGVALDPPFLQGAARLIEDLGGRGVVRGAM